MGGTMEPARPARPAKPPRCGPLRRQSTGGGMTKSVQGGRRRSRHLFERVAAAIEQGRSDASRESRGVLTNALTEGDDDEVSCSFLPIGGPLRSWDGRALPRSLQFRGNLNDGSESESAATGGTTGTSGSTTGSSTSAGTGAGTSSSVGVTTGTTGREEPRAAAPAVHPAPAEVAPAAPDPSGPASVGSTSTGGDPGTGGGDDGLPPTGNNSVAYTGCSMANNIGTGYKRVGGKIMWNSGQLSNGRHGGPELDQPEQLFLAALRPEDGVDRRKDVVKAIMVQICILSQKATDKELRDMVNAARQHVNPGTHIYIVGQPVYNAGHDCFIAGTGGADWTDMKAQELAGTRPSTRTRATSGSSSSTTTRARSATAARQQPEGRERAGRAGEGVLRGLIGALAQRDASCDVDGRAPRVVARAATARPEWRRRLMMGTCAPCTASGRRLWPQICVQSGGERCS